MKTQIEFYEHGCKSFFKKHCRQRASMEKMISKAIVREVKTGMTKVKLATRKKIAGRSIYEFRLNLGKIGSARVAFALAQDQAVVYFISSHLQKATFSHEFAQVVARLA